MKTLKMAICAALFATTASADPAVGTWQTEVDDGSFAYISMQPCGNAICGTIARTFENGGTEYTSPNIGKKIVLDMVPTGGGEYEGRVWRPSNDKIYVGKMTVSGNALRLRGCVAGGLICASQNWARIN